MGEDQALSATTFEVEAVNWVSISRPEFPVAAEVKIRHKHLPAPAEVEALDDSRARITFRAPQRAITPGQAAVFYIAHQVLGGGWIR